MTRTVTTLPTVTVGGRWLTIEDVVAISRDGAGVEITADPAVRGRLEMAHDIVEQALERGDAVYGVSTRFGAMADGPLARSDAIELQSRSLWSHKTGAGRVLPYDAVRAAMVVRMSSHLRGHSGVRMELVERLARFLNEFATPQVREFGSIGASGDLVPLSYICGCVIGSPGGFRVDLRGEMLDAREVLDRLGLEPFQLKAKEGLAMMNGTSLSAGMAALHVAEVRMLLAGTLAFHALATQALAARREYFEPFVNELNAHPGQRWVAAAMAQLLDRTQVCADTVAADGHAPGTLIQDRYSVRCIPQFLGPLVEDLLSAEQQIEAEVNGCSDNPIIDVDGGGVHHGGNFLAQYVAQAEDRLRYGLAMSAKHVDAQIALLMTPEFSNGLPPSLTGNPADGANLGLKGLQITGNSIVPLLLHHAMPIADRFQTHAEQFNQNVNSQSLAACLLCGESLHMYRQYLSIALLVAVQAVDLRAEIVSGSHDPRPLLSPSTLRVYEAIRAAVQSAPNAAEPYVHDDDGQPLDLHIERVADALAPGGGCRRAIESLDLGRPKRR